MHFYDNVISATGATASCNCCGPSPCCCHPQPLTISSLWVCSCTGHLCLQLLQHCCQVVSITWQEQVSQHPEQCSDRVALRGPQHGQQQVWVKLHWQATSVKVMKQHTQAVKICHMHCRANALSPCIEKVHHVPVPGSWVGCLTLQQDWVGLFSGRADEGILKSTHPCRRLPMGAASKSPALTELRSMASSALRACVNLG